MKNNIDKLIQKAFEQEYKPEPELNEMILEQAKRRKKGRRIVWGLPRVAVIAFAVLCMGGAGVYAANSILKDVFITDHSISSGNPDNVNDEAIAQPEVPVTTEHVLHEEGNETVNWISKDVQIVNGSAKNTYYIYEDYETALLDAGLDNWFCKSYEAAENAVYVITETEDLQEYCVSASFLYGGGSFHIEEEILKGNISEDTAYSVKLTNTNNKRTYTSASGQDFTLVDEMTENDGEKTVKTFVMIAYDNYYGYIFFENLSDAEIHQILDTVKIGK